MLNLPRPHLDGRQARLSTAVVVALFAATPLLAQTPPPPAATEPERLVVLPVSAELPEDQTAAAKALPLIVDAYRQQGRFIVLTLDAVKDKLSAEAYEDAADGCLKLTCARAVADALDVDFVAYPSFQEHAEGRVFEIKVFSKADGRPVVKGNAVAPNADVIVPAMSAVVGQAIPPVPTPKTEEEQAAAADELPPEEPGFFDNPFIILGSSVLFVGAFAIAFGIAHVTVSSFHIATPEVSRNLKKIALDWWWVGLASAGGGVAALALGAGVVGVGVAQEALE